MAILLSCKYVETDDYVGFISCNPDLLQWSGLSVKGIFVIVSGLSCRGKKKIYRVKM